MEVLVFSKRIIQRSKEEIEKGAISLVSQDKQSCYSLPQRQASHGPSLSLAALEALTWEKVGIIRSKETLEEVANTLAAWEKSLERPLDRPSYELNNRGSSN
jgi:aspartate oxidase